MSADADGSLPHIRVLICDDHEVFRRGLAMVLGPEDDLEVVGEAVDGGDALAQARALAPDVVLMDVRMPGGGGIEATRAIAAELPAVRIIVLTVSDEDADLYEAVKAGAMGYLLKEVSIEEVGDAVRAVAAGQSLISPSMASKLLAEFSSLSRQVEQHTAPIPPRLTDRETDVLRLVARGLPNRGIAERLDIAENTVKNHVRSILEKLHLHSRTEAALYAVRERIVDPG
ncbi:MAG: putative Protein-glutamate methylesterase [Acidimicrobiales bacterium]|nr:putative Protein-glutamate methylesterase [Acidimicrobiales bacterium]